MRTMSDPQRGRVRGLLLVVSALVCGAVAVWHPGCGDTQRSPLDRAWRTGLRRIDSELERGSHRSAREALGRLRSEVDQIESVGGADADALARVRENLECLSLEIQAWEAYHAGNEMLARGVIGLAQTQRDCTGDSARRLQSLLDRVEDGTEPAVPRPPRPGPPDPQPRVSGPVPEVYGVRWLEIPGRVYEVGTPMSEHGRDAEYEIDPHRVRVRTYLIATTEITQRTFSHYVPRTWRLFPGPDRPAHSVSYKDAEDFCEELTRRVPGFSFRLPTETEWEVACRGTRHPSDGPVALPDAGDQKSVKSGTRDKAEWVLRKYAWFGLDRNEPQPVGGRKPTSTWFDPGRTHGLYDMHGNVAEWCRRDEARRWKQPGLLEQVVRGGSYQSQFERCRAGARGFQKADSTLPSIGFRIVAVRR